MKRRLSMAVFVLLTANLFAQTEGKPNNIYAQKLVDDSTAKYVRLISLGIHAKAPGASDYTIVAHTSTKHIGAKSEEEDLTVMRTGKPDGPNDLGGGIWDVILPLHDASGKTIGVAVMHVKPDSKAEAVKLAENYRDEIAKQIPNESKLFEPRD